MSTPAKQRIIARVTSLRSLQRLVREPLHANGLILLANSVLGSTLGFAFWLVAARLFTADEVGLGTAVVSSAITLAGISNLGLGLGITRFIHEMPVSRGNALINSSLTVALFCSALATVGFLLGLPLLSPRLTFIYQSPGWIALFATGVAGWTVAPLVDQSLLAHRSASAVLLRNLVLHALKLALPFVLIAAGGTAAVYLSFSLPTALSCAVGIWLLGRRFRPTYRFSLESNGLLSRRDVLLYSVATHFGHFLQQLPILVLPLLVVNRLGEAQTALYYVALMIVTALQAITTSFAASAFVEGSTASGDAGPLIRAARTALPAIVLGMAVTFATAPSVLRLFGVGYDSATGLLRLLVLAAPLHAALTLLTTYWRLRKDTRSVNLLSIAYAIGLLGSAALASNLVQYGYAIIVGTGLAVAIGLWRLRKS